jgi:hypothetical protein
MSGHHRRSGQGPCRQATVGPHVVMLVLPVNHGLLSVLEIEKPVPLIGTRPECGRRPLPETPYRSGRPTLPAAYVKNRQHLHHPHVRQRVVHEVRSPASSRDLFPARLYVIHPGSSFGAGAEIDRLRATALRHDEVARRIPRRSLTRRRRWGSLGQSLATQPPPKCR